MVYLTEYQSYIELFSKTIGDMTKAFEAMFSSFLQDWGGGVIIPLDGLGTNRFLENPDKFSPFCFFVRETLGQKQTCFECDARMAEEASKIRKPIDYWCDWGMRDIAVPIVLHGVPIGTIFCGQRTLQGEEDEGGEAILRNFAVKHGLLERIPDLVDKRKLSGSVSRPQIDDVKRFLWATSHYISQVLYSRLERELQDQGQGIDEKLASLFSLVRDIGRTSNIWRFWSDYERVLLELTHAFDALGAVVLMAQDGKTNFMCDYGLNLQIDSHLLKESELITSMCTFHGPGHFRVSGSTSFPSCPVSRKAIENNPGINLILYGKASLDINKNLHFILFFSHEVERKNPYLLHQKERILSQLILGTVTAFSHVEHIDQLKKTIAEKEQFIQDVVHQIRAPFHGILAYCDNLLDPEFPKERKDRILRYLRDLVHHVSILVKSVEYAARGDSNIFTAEKINFAPHSLTAALVDYVILMQGYAKDENISIHVDESTTDTVGWIMIDKQKLEIAMINILFNAVKYSFPKTHISVSASLDLETNRVIVRTTNLGVEIPREKWEEIFKLRIRTPLAVKYSQSGLGIGLFVTNEIMKAIGGAAFVKSSVRTGRTYKDFEEFENTIVIAFPYRKF